ncbi:MAG TPA: prepilin-type N-terminal cleavage/methylation domain-containing protein, partial [Desulfosarcina sp.]|nr:prepilin-type N-terminal cleavage/methylation domain-containing protein [Desulfosarcina sp.]
MAIRIPGNPPSARTIRRGSAGPHRLMTPRAAGFTLLEIMLALGIFAGVLAAIYASWTSILRATQATHQAAARVQRERLAVRTLEEALAAAQVPRHNPAPYAFVADTSEEFGALSFVARLPESYPRSGRFHGLAVRRVQFAVEPDETGVP